MAASQLQVTELRAVKESTTNYDRIEARIKAVFRSLLYAPLLREISLSTGALQNADSSPLLEAIRAGRVRFSRGRFEGRFSAGVVKELRQLGAKWDAKTSAYTLSSALLTPELKHAIGASEVRFQAKISAIAKKLEKFLPEKLAESIDVRDLFSSTLWKVDREIKSTLKGISVPPTLTPHQAGRIVDEWQENMDIWIKDFAADEIVKLRKSVQRAAFSGDRYGDLVKSIQRSYGVTANKAKFLARQETSLLMTKFKETRYTDSGVHEYRWGCVAGSKNHPVRPSHKILEGKIFRWDTPPITSAPDEPPRRNNPGQDYNCRCFAKPIVKFKT